jgi:hypothetical protein
MIGAYTTGKSSISYNKYDISIGRNKPWEREILGKPGFQARNYRGGAGEGTAKLRIFLKIPKYFVDMMKERVYNFFVGIMIYQS